MSTIRMKIAAMAAAAAGVLLVAPAAPAQAAINPNTLVTVQVRVDGAGSDGLSSGNVGCPVGTKVIATGLTHARMTGLIPRPDFNGVLASGAPQGTGANQFMIIQATCAPVAQLTGFVPMQKTFPFSGSVVRKGIVTCPAGMYAVGGGGMVLNSRGTIAAGVPMVANTPSADGRSWLVTVMDAVPGDTLHVIMQCAPNDRSTLSETSFAPNSSLSDVVTCGITGRSLGAGLSLVAPDGSDAQGALTLLSQIGTSGWFVNSTSTTPNARLVVRNRCLEP